MTTLASVIGRGLLADRPAFGTEGRLYYATDSGILYRDSGAAWESIEGTTGGIGGAPADATYVTLTANGTLSAEALLSAVIGYGVASSRPAFGTAGRLYYATDTDTLSRDSGSAWNDVTLDWGQVTGKPSTFAPTAHDHTTGDGSGVLTNDEHDGYSQYVQITAPSSPPSNSIRVYAKDKSGTATLYYKDEAGVEYELPTISSGGAGSGAPVDAHYITTQAESGLTAETLLSAVIGSGIASARPGFGTAGRLYYATDTHVLSRDTGAAWVTIQVDWGTGIASIPSTFAPSNHNFWSSTHPDVDATDTPNDGEVVTWNAAASKFKSTALPTASTPGHAIYDEASSLTQRDKMKFTGTGVTATDDGVDTTVVTIPGSAAVTAIEVSDTALGAVEGNVDWRGTRKVLDLYDGARERGISLVGFLPIAWPNGTGPAVAASSTQTLAAAGGSTAIPISVPGHMLLRGMTYRNPDTSLARSMEWRLYEDRQNASNTLDEIAGANGSESFTAAAASVRSVAVGSPPVYLGPGLYWLVIRNSHASNALGITIVATSLLLPNMTQSKTLGSSLGSTLDFVAASWTKATGYGMVELHGQVFGQSSSY